MRVLSDLPWNTLRFDNSYITQLPGDPREDNSRRQVFGALYSRVGPTAVQQPQLLAYSAEVAELLRLTPAACATPEFAEVFGGNALLPGMEPWACNYGGHQFGVWAGQLGDGRAMSLGEVLTPAGARWELQLKGAGPTPYSRGADGRAVLRSSVREFLCSEAMHHLGVPTTRALSLVGTGEGVLRDMFYDGNPRLEPGAIVCRVAPSFIRFGHFELPAARHEPSVLKTLIDYTLRRDYAHLLEAGGPNEETYGAFFHEVCVRTARLVSEWMRVGFVHGVMNTDNMSILGLTIDYGPYGWVDDFDPNWTPNTTDAQGRRYAFGQQAGVAVWNLQQLAGALAPLFERHEALQAGLDAYVETFNAATQAALVGKLGLGEWQADDRLLVRRLETVLRVGEVDMTLFYRGLMRLDLHAPDINCLEAAFYDAGKRQAVEADLVLWLQDYARRVSASGQLHAERQAAMERANPCYVLRNYLAQEAIDAAEAGDYTLIHTLLDVLRNPYTEQPGRERFAQRRPDWARHRAGCSMLSCSS